MNRKMLLLTAILILVLGVKYAFGQGAESAINWDAVLQKDPVQDVGAVMLASSILGAIFGALRLLRTNSSRPALVFLRLN